MSNPTIPIIVSIDNGTVGLDYTETMQFSGGELQVKLPIRPYGTVDQLGVLARLQSPADLVQLMLFEDVVERFYPGVSRNLVIPYLPYGRQDRVTELGNAFTLKAVAKMINTLNYGMVVTLDPHSDVTPALIDRLEPIEQAHALLNNSDMGPILHDRRVVIVAPDAGAHKKAAEVSRQFGRPLLQAMKHRDVHTGKVLSCSVPDFTPAVNEPHFLIVDDICDGGATFVQLAQKLSGKWSRSKVSLYVSHGIFSKGFKDLNAYFDGIYTTNSWLRDGADTSDKLKVFRLFEEKVLQGGKD